MLKKHAVVCIEGLPKDIGRQGQVDKVWFCGFILLLKGARNSSLAREYSGLASLACPVEEIPTYADKTIHCLCESLATQSA